MATTAVAERPGAAPPALESRARPPERRPTDRSRRSTALAAAALLIFVVGLVASASQRVPIPFGGSHDGRNADVWGSGSRSLRENGPIESRLGTRSLVAGQAVPYANHPPLIGVEAAVAEAVLGERPWVTRLPAWAGALAALVLAFLLLRACRLRPLAAAVGVVLGFGCPMFATYGTMLDTTMVSLPFGVAVLWLWQRSRGGRPAPTPVVVAVSVLACLTSWLGLLTVVLVGGAALVDRVRARRDEAPPDEGAAGVRPAPAAGFAFLDDRRRTGSERWSGLLGGVAGCLVAVAVALGLAGTLVASPSTAAVGQGAGGGAALRAAAYPAGQQQAWYLGDIVKPVDWISYATRRPAAELGTPGDVDRLAARAPGELVLVSGERLRSDVRSPGPNPGCRAGVPDGHGFVVLPAAVLAANLARPPAACPA